VVTVLKVDVDVKLDDEQLKTFIDSRILILRYLGFNEIHYTMSETQKGYHFWFIVQEDLDDKNCAFIQFLLGDDIKRYKYNLIRVEANCFKDFNVLFQEKRYRGKLRKIWDRVRRVML
jgi:hypothetical protein